MEESNKRSNQTFLDKFRGRTNKIDKHGVNHVLDPSLHPPPAAPEPPARRRKLASLERSDFKDEKTPKMELEELLPSNPEGKHPHLSKRSTRGRLTPSKVDFLPSLYSPAQLERKDPLPPSRSISDKSEPLQRRVFGKYLKLDDEAQRHFEFLVGLDKRKADRKGSAGLSQR